MWESVLALILLAAVLFLAKAAVRWHRRRTEAKAVATFIKNLVDFSRSNR